MNALETVTSLVRRARVLEARGRDLTLDVAGESRRALSALSIEHEFLPGDEVVVLAAEECFVVGVLTARGGARLCSQARVEILAPEVSLRAGLVTTEAERVEVRARTLTEKLTRSMRWITGLAQTFAGRLRHVVSGSATLQAERIVEQAQGEVRIDGERIHLG